MYGEVSFNAVTDLEYALILVRMLLLLSVVVMIVLVIHVVTRLYSLDQAHSRAHTSFFLC